MPSDRRRDGIWLDRGTLTPVEDPKPLMSLLLSAIGATVAAVLEVALGQYIEIGDAVPHFVLVLGVIWTIAAGIEGGIAWAFVGGLVLDALFGRPLGASAFSLLVAVGGARLFAQPLVRLRLLAPIVAVPILSLVYSVIITVLTSPGQPASVLGASAAQFVPGALYDGVFGLVLGPLIVSAHDRRLPAERALEW
jgi:rod shape-determining protein MreD